MPIYRLNSSFSWKRLSNIYRVNSSFAWKKLSAAYRLNSSFSWKRIFSGITIKIPSIAQRVTISSQTDSEGFVTLTGTNYRWTDATSLTYFFEWSQNNGSSWSTIDTGSITNPSAGSSNTRTYMILQNDALANIDNLYRFRVRAINENASNDSISQNNVTINAPRNISILYFSKTFSSITVEFDTPLYASSYQIQIGTNTFQSVTGTVVGGKTRVTATSLSPNTSYDIKVRGYTGILGSVFGTAYNKGYHGNFSNIVSATTDQAPVPTQITAPSAPAGNGLAFTPMAAGNSGTYNNYSGNIVTVLVSILSTSTPINGSSTAQGTVRQALYEVTQNDATTPVQRFYTRDAVTALNGTVYYYYSSPVSAFVGTVTDNFNRSVASGLGTTSSTYFYNSFNNRTSTWSVNGSAGINSTEVAFATAANQYPLQTIEINNPNRTYSIKSPNGSSGGVGVAYWVTGAGSWWATIPYYLNIQSDQTTYSCGGSGSGDSCPDNFTSTYNSTTVGRRCSSCTSSNTTVYGCFDNAVTTGCPNNFTFEYNAFTVGRRCSNCVESIVTTYGCGGSVNGDTGCPDNFTSTYSASTLGRRCSSCTSSNVTTYSCSGSGSSSTGCPSSFTFEYGPSTVGTRCSSCSSTSSTTYQCGNEAQEPNDPGTIVSCTQQSHVGSPCSKFFVTAGVWLVSRCQSATTTTWTWNTVAASTSTVFSYNTVNSSVSVSNSYTVVGSSQVTTFSYSTVSSSTVTSRTYYTFLDIVNSGIVASTKELAANTVAGAYNSSNYSRIYSHSTIISNNTITAKAFNISGQQIGQDLVYTASNPTKFGTLGDTSAGVIKGHTNDLNGNTYDDLLIQ